MTRPHSIGAPGDLVDGIEFTGRHVRQTRPATAPRGGIVESVARGSPAARIGIHRGDILQAVNGNRLRDVVDYQFYSADALLELEVVDPVTKAHRTAQILKDEGQSLGITFNQPTFTPIRECNNHCPFCFIDQLPGEMRAGLYIRDDDYRYSFLYGNFVTLTNLNERDWKRLGEQRLSPLYVSVHSTDLALRRLLLGNDRAPDIMAQLERLFSLRIRIHAQIVVCPGINDDDDLDRTVMDLAGRHPGVLSIGIVPVGLTRTPAEILAGPGASCSRILPSAAELDLRTFTQNEARRVVDQTAAWQIMFRKRLGVSLVYASDEIYLLGDSGVPPADSYDDYPQYENGIGMVRDLLDDWASAKLRVNACPASSWRSVSVVTGEMASPVLGPMIEEWSALTRIHAELIAVPNTFFGPRVRVAGLLTGRDIIASRHRLRGDLVVLPEVMLDKTGSRLLDNLTPGDLETALGKPVRFAAMMSVLDTSVRQSPRQA